jgi:two-component system, OmpR family, phosphate regulon sensor histidine kinase PhoR
MGSRVEVTSAFELLAAERDQLRRLLDRLEQGIIGVDRALRVEVANERAQRIMGSGLVEGEPLPEPWPDQVSLRELVTSLYSEGALGGEARVTLAEGARYEIAGLPAGMPGTSAVLLVTDVSTRQRAERIEREFVANASHELRTPLATITGAVEILQSGAKEIPAVRDRFLGHIQREVDRLSSLVRALLVLARAQAKSEAPRLAPVELRPLLDDVASVVNVPQGVEIVVACPPALAAQADSDLLHEIVANLAANAASHTTEGRITLSATADEGSVVIDVRDTGSGIDPAQQEHLFERFYRPGGRDSTRFGLGLAIVREAVVALGGEIVLESAKGRGTTARVRLPVAERTST